jgi:DNA sulfur modification protein DndB
MTPEQRAQRSPTEKRVPEIAHYILDHEDDWAFSSLTATFDAEEMFNPSEISDELGILRLPITTEFLINDGQHWRAGIALALEQNRQLGKQHISVVLFPLESLECSQQVSPTSTARSTRPRGRSTSSTTTAIR